MDCKYVNGKNAILFKKIPTANNWRTRVLLLAKFFPSQIFKPSLAKVEIIKTIGNKIIKIDLTLLEKSLLV